MALITNADLKTLTDHLGVFWLKTKDAIGQVEDSGTPVVGTLQDKADQIVDLIVEDLDDADQINDLMNVAITMFGQTNAQALFGTGGSGGGDGLFSASTSSTGWVSPMLDAIDAHMLRCGSQVNASIISLATYLSYYNGGAGGAAYTCLVTPEFARLWQEIKEEALPPEGVMGASTHPSYNPDASANGMGALAVGGAFADGDEIDDEVTAPVDVVLEVTTTFANGSDNPVVTITGPDDEGDPITYATVNLGANNPTTAISTTITPAVTLDGRRTVVVASLTGIVAGSIMTVNSGLVDEEVINVEEIDAGAVTITAVFRKSHLAGAALTGKRTFAVDIGFRVTDITDLDIAGTGHNAGAVRVYAVQDRSCV